jgi:hypothetical protein
MKFSRLCPTTLTVGDDVGNPTRESAGTQSRDTPAKGKPSQGTVLELEPSQGNPMKGKPSQGKVLEPSQGIPSEGKSQPKASLG